LITELSYPWLSKLDTEHNQITEYAANVLCLSAEHLNLAWIQN